MRATCLRCRSVVWRRYVLEQANDTDLHDLISSMWPVERHGSGRGEEGEESSVAFEEESDA